MCLVSLDAPESQFALFDLDWNCTLGVALTADRERRARLGVNYGDHLTGKSELPFLTVAR